MPLKIWMVLLLLFSGAEIFFNVFTIIFAKIISLFKKNYTISENIKTAIKLIFVILFFVGVIYFLIIVVKVISAWFGIPLDKNIFDIFR